MYVVGGFLSEIRVFVGFVSFFWAIGFCPLLVVIGIGENWVGGCVGYTHYFAAFGTTFGIINFDDTETFE